MTAKERETLRLAIMDLEHNDGSLWHDGMEKLYGLLGFKYPHPRHLVGEPVPFLRLIVDNEKGNRK